MNILEILSPEELKKVTEKNNFLASLTILSDWFIIIATFALMSLYTNPLTILIGTFILGGRQLGLGIVVHETGHRTLFSSKNLNDFVGNWLAGYWVFSDKDTYIKGHLNHHREAGTKDDPDLSNYQNYPITYKSLKRKITRDLTGQVGWRRIKSIASATARFSSLNSKMQQYLLRSYGVNLGMLIIMTLFGAPWLFLCWLVAFMTSHMFVVRVRQIAEHAAVPDLFDSDARKNTRTLYISWLERLLIAPHGVNYHMEHHILASVPIYRLALMHRILLAKGYYSDIKFQTGYFNLLKQVVQA
ncbi:MAG: fatty acid desaturase family protein [Pseudomonadales bacterium]|nr:fatty acid desaturase family protein [Pseudomonadales bacterium]